jgi:hypothetical protein
MSTRVKIAVAIAVVILAGVGFLIYHYGPFGQASVEETTSYRLSLFVYPYEVKADGKNQAKIVAVVKQKQDAVANVKIFFSSTLGELSESQKTTDTSGQAVVYLKSKTAGEARITALAADKSKSAKVIFVGE